MSRIVSLILVLSLTSAARADKLVLFAGGGDGKDNVPATQAKLHEPFAIDFDRDGNAYVVELSNRLLKIDKAGKLTVLAEGKGPAADETPVGKATFNGPHNLLVRDGVVYIADTWNSRIRKYDPQSGLVTSIAGMPYPAGKKSYEYSGDGGPALQAKFSGVYSIDFGPNGDKLYIDDLENRRVRVLDMKSGQVDLVAGNGKKGTPENGADAKESPLSDPRAVAADKNGNVYILERGGGALRVVDAKGKIRTLVGGGKLDVAGDSFTKGLAGPKHLIVDRQGDVIIADSGNHIIRKYSPATEQLTRIAGSGMKGPSGDGGDALSVSMNEPHGVAIHPDGTLFIVDSKNGRIFRMVK